jgi:hypothetical protein
MSRYQQDLERGFIMLAAYDHACERRPLTMAAAREQMFAELEVEANYGAWLDEQEARLRAMQRHPAGKGRGFSEVDLQVYDEGSPAPDPIHWAPRMSSWDIVRDLVALARKAVRR